MGLLEPLARRRCSSLGRRLGVHVEARETVLDVGAGNGRISRWLRDHLGVFPTLCDGTEYSNRDGSLPFLRKTEDGIIPAENASFDTVLLVFVLHHLETRELQEGLLAEAARVTRKRVIVVEDTPGSPWDHGMNRLFDWSLNVGHGIPIPFTFRSAAEWPDAFRRIGLRMHHAETFRSGWPTFGLYRQSLFVAMPDGSGA